MCTHYLLAVTAFMTLFDAVEREIENIEIAQPTGRRNFSVFRCQRARQDEWYLPLAKAPMRAQTMAGEARKVVLGTCRSNSGVGITEDDEVGLAIERQLEPTCCFGTVERKRDPGQLGACRDYAGEIHVTAKITADKRAEGAVMAYEGIGDRADHPHGSHPETLVQHILEKDHIGLAARERLVVHAVVGDEPDDGAELGKATYPIVDRAMKGVGHRIARRVRMLDIIRQRQIKQMGLAPLEQRDPGVEHK